MKLVIIGAGGYGQTVSDLAVQSWKYSEVLFLDVNEELLRTGKTAGRCNDYQKYIVSGIYSVYIARSVTLNVPYVLLHTDVPTYKTH